ncbi:uncharacterized protein PSFLO_04955 [Pseudozyma flocculosa]|uniref:Uncharacterized protein n=1 Tax=Pseudozyma flocculosa TaxID=84751 RepID=A0A5C3F4N9_9BASI|nr:uncharacterized protein PSFLO_04955 [Pseudozyma flocculosa]
MDGQQRDEAPTLAALIAPCLYSPRRTYRDAVHRGREAVSARGPSCRIRPSLDPTPSRARVSLHCGLGGLAALSDRLASIVDQGVQCWPANRAFERAKRRSKQPRDDSREPWPVLSSRLQQ